MKNRGFTLVELLVVLAIVSIMASVTVSVSYNMYQAYQSAVEAERVVALVSTTRLESFLYNKFNIISSKEGKLTVNSEPVKGYENIFFQVEQPIKYFQTGTTSGGIIKMTVNNYKFALYIKSPFGDLTLSKE
ncbi:MAG: type II secretion system GspH family protein [Thermodesulfovibrionales bacterium]|nr:type II secretion system GspH family protein [Thermodesulfovibrionales bacterium]